MSLMKIKDKNGRWQDVPIIAGPQGPQGEKGEKGDTGELGADEIDKITDPDNNPIEEIEDEIYVIPMELGGYDTDNGDPKEREDAIRSVDFISVIPEKTVYFTASVPISDGGSVRVCCYDADKAFVETRYVKLDTDLTISSRWRYLKLYRSDTNDKTIEMALVTRGTTQKIEFKKVYFADHGYAIYGAPIDDETMHKLVIASAGKDGNTYNIVELRAPDNHPQEATFALKNSGDDAKQFVDFSSMVYDPDDPTVEIVCQTRGGYKLPAFSIRFNDGLGAGRVKKFVVHPDAIPIEMTSLGLKVRKNNTYDNNGSDEDYVIVNLADMVERIDDMDEQIGDVGIALDNIIALQNELMLPDGDESIA